MWITFFKKSYPDLVPKMSNVLTMDTVGTPTDTENGQSFVVASNENKPYMITITYMYE